MGMIDIPSGRVSLTSSKADKSRVIGAVVVVFSVVLEVVVVVVVVVVVLVVVVVSVARLKFC